MSTHAPAAKRFLKRWSRRLFALAALGLHPARRRELLPGLRILTYHRLADDPRDPFAVRPQDFIRQTKVLSERGGVVALEEVLSQAGGGSGNAPGSLSHLTMGRSISRRSPRLFCSDWASRPLFTLILQRSAPPGS